MMVVMMVLRLRLKFKWDDVVVVVVDDEIIDFVVVVVGLELLACLETYLNSHYTVFEGLFVIKKLKI